MRMRGAGWVRAAAGMVLLAASVCGGQSLAKLKIGDAAAGLEPLGPAAATAPDDDFRNQRWTLANGNDLAVTTSPDGRIVFLESDWGGKETDPGCDLPGLKFGETTLTELRKRFGSGGFGFHNRSTALENVDGSVVLMNSYEVGTNVVTFITKVAAEEYARGKQAGDAWKMEEHAKLDAVMISDQNYAVREWGVRVYDPDYKKIEWK